MKWNDCTDCDKGTQSIIGMIGCLIYGVMLGMVIGGVIIGKFGAQLAALGW